MATYYTDQYRNVVLGTFVGIGFSYTSLYLALMTDPSSFSEVSNGEYSRKPASFTIESGLLSNTNEIRFDTSATSWGTVSGVGLAQSATGQILLSADISPFLNVQPERQVVFAAGQITLSL